MQEQESIFNDLKYCMDNDLILFKKSISRLKTGRASLSILDDFKVNYYGKMTPLNQIASISVFSDSRQLIISPWDISIISNIEKSILKSDLGLNPTNDGKTLKITIQPLTEEKRKEIVKIIYKLAEENKIRIRNERRNANEQLKNLKKNNKISEDNLFSLQKEVQKITDDFIKKINKLVSEKEIEIMTI